MRRNVSSAAAVVAAAIAIVGAGAPGVATAADGCPNAAIRAQQQSSHLPDCRAYEQVTPVDKNGYPTYDFGGTPGLGAVASSSDGQAALYPSWGIFADGRSGMPTQYRSRRTSGGWVAQAVSPPPRGGNPDAVFTNSGTTWGNATPDLRFGLIYTTDPLDPTHVGRAYDVYVTDGGAPTLASRGNGAERSTNPNTNADAISDDGAHVVFSSSSQLVPQDAGRITAIEVADLYDRFGGTTYPINVDGHGQLISACGSELAGGNGGNFSGRVSSDGARVIFTVPHSAAPVADPQCDAAHLVPRLFMRIDNERTVEITRSRAQPLTQTPTFLGAARDGSVVYFSSPDQLTSTPDGGIYRYEPDTDRLELVVSKTVVTDFVKVSPDGSRLYFTSKKQLVPGRGVEANVMLYVLRGGTIHFVADSGTSQGFTHGHPGVDVTDSNERTRPVGVSADGHRLVFSSDRDLTGVGTDGKVEVYLYDEETDAVQCVSCGSSGPSRTSTLPRGRISADGSVIAFVTGERLGARDVNNADDVYRWKDGNLSLVSSGRGVKGDILVGVSDDGSSIFFSSYSSLAPQDVDDGDQDMYVARVDGGFAAVEDGREACTGDACQPASSVAPLLGRAASSTFAGVGNVPAIKPAVRPAKPRVVAVSFARGSRVVLRVTIAGRGRVTLGGRGLRRVSRSVARAGSYRVSVSLTAAGARVLARRGVLRRAVQVAFVSAGARTSSSARVSVTFRAVKQVRS